VSIRVHPWLKNLECREEIFGRLRLVRVPWCPFVVKTVVKTVVKNFGTKHLNPLFAGHFG
jgi:hypothetical protein